MSNVLIMLAPGFEEAEAIITADVLKRMGFGVTLAGIDDMDVAGSHQMTVRADALLNDLNPADYRAAILPGGLPGAANLRDSAAVKRAVLDIYANGGIAAAICAAPLALAAFGLLDGKTVTGYPGMEKEFGNARYTGRFTETDGRIITGKGPAAAFKFGAAIGEALGKSSAAVMAGMLVNDEGGE
jgi:4-methyl-5(b-hydroxyethyl)-thiazole monophosphate biosynthesis